MKRQREISLSNVFQEFENTVKAKDICPKKQCKKFLKVVTGTGLFPKTREDLRTIIEVILQGEGGGGIGNPDLNRRCWICFYQSYYKLVHDSYDPAVGDDFGLEYLGPDYLSAVSKDIATLVGSKLDYEDIKALCQTNRRLNEIVCNNQDFYRALRRRDYGGTWNFFMLPEEILPIDDCEAIDNFFGKGTPIYWNWFRGPAKIVENGTGSSLIRAASLPGTGNTVRIHDTDYIWYYFMWAPKFNRQVNYDKKFTNSEILEELKLNPPIRPSFGPLGGRGPSNKRMDLIRKSGVLKDSNPFINMNLLGQPLARLSNRLESLYPRMVKNADLEYSLSPTTLLFGMMCDDTIPAESFANTRLQKEEYARRLEKFGIIPQLVQFENEISAISPPNANTRPVMPDDPVRWERNVRRAIRNKLERTKTIVKGMILSHEQNNNSVRDPEAHVFEFSESFWPDNLHEQMVRIYDVTTAKLREIQERW